MDPDSGSRRASQGGADAAVESAGSAVTVALVTGAAGRIGRACSTRLAQAGHTVVLADLAEAAVTALAAELADQGLAAIPFAGDLSDAAVRKALLDLVATTGQLAVLVNNAALFADPLLAEADDQLWQDVMNVNLLAPAALIRDGVPLMTDGGSIINMSSVRGRVSLGRGAAYEAAKAGLLAITRCFAVELSARGIRVNAVCPGTIHEGGLDGFGPDLREIDRLAFASASTNGEIGLPDEIGSVVAFLASAESSLINGADIAVGGGTHGMHGFTAAQRAAESVLT